MLEANKADGIVIAVATDGEHRFSKVVVDRINIVTGLGIEGDAHHGFTVQHRSRVAIDPTQPNLRQVHLIQIELLEELEANCFRVKPGDLGENIVTRCINLLGLPKNSVLRIGRHVVLEVTGLRNPCAQIERFQSGLLAGVLGRGQNGELVRKAGIMTVVLNGGVVQPQDSIVVEMPPLPYLPLECV